MDWVQLSQGYRATIRKQLLLTNFKQNKTPKTDPKIVKQQTSIAIIRHALSFTQANRAL